jgi:hypothetical protein
MNLAVDAALAHAPRNQLRVLGAEVENQNPVGVNVHYGRRPAIRYPPSAIRFSIS